MHYYSYITTILLKRILPLVSFNASYISNFIDWITKIVMTNFENISISDTFVNQLIGESLSV